VTSGPPAADAARLAAPERAVLLGLARRAVEAAARGEAGPDVAAVGAGGALAAPGAAFVTLHLHGQLRGCIGTVTPRGEPLAQNVVAMARAAAVEDPRFPPLRPDELADVDLEISVLGPLVPVERPDEIVVGRDGLLVEEGFRRGLLLPQVPVEWAGAGRPSSRRPAPRPACPPTRGGATRGSSARAEVFGEPDHPS